MAIKRLLSQAQQLAGHRQAVCKRKWERPSGNSYFTQSLHPAHWVGLEKGLKPSPPLHYALSPMSTTNLEA